MCLSGQSAVTSRTGCLRKSRPKRVLNAQRISALRAQGLGWAGPDVRTKRLGTTSSSLDLYIQTCRPLAPNNLPETLLRRIMPGTDTYAFQVIISVHSK